jgi:tripartite motif-containing protein 71
VAVDGQANIYVSDTGNDRIQKLAPDGTVLAVWGGSGAAPGEFRQPYGVAVDRDGNVYVTDQWNNRIQKLDSGGRPLAVCGSFGRGPGEFYYPRAVALDTRGNVYIGDSFNQRVQKLSADGAPLAQWSARQPAGRSEGLTVDQSGALFVVEVGGKDPTQVGDGSDGTGIMRAVVQRLVLQANR